MVFETCMNKRAYIDLNALINTIFYKLENLRCTLRAFSVLWSKVTTSTMLSKKSPYFLASKSTIYATVFRLFKT